MKRNFTAKGLFLLAALTLTAIVNTTSAQVEWGIIGGLNNSNMAGKKYTNIPGPERAKFSGISRFRVGIFMDYPLNNYFSFSPEVAYAVKGAVQKLDTFRSYTDVVPGWDDDVKSVSNLDLNYIEIPLLFRVSMPIGHPTALYPYENSVKPFYLDFMVGPHISYLLSAKNEFSYTQTRTSTNDPSEDYNFSKKFSGSNSPAKIKKIDYGFVAGAALKWRFNRKSYLCLDLRYTMSFANINGGFWDRNVAKVSDPTQRITEKPKVSNAGSFSVSLGLITNFSKRRYFNLFKPDKNRPDGR